MVWGAGWDASPRICSGECPNRHPFDMFLFYRIACYICMIGFVSRDPMWWLWPHILPCIVTFISMETLTLGLYRIYFLPIRPEPDFAGFGMTVIVLIMCKTLRTYEWFEFLIVFCPAVTVTTFLISVVLTYSGLLDYVSTVPCYIMSGKNRLFKSGNPAPVGFFAGAGFGKCRIPPYLTCDLCTDGSQRSFDSLALHLVV